MGILSPINNLLRSWTMLKLMKALTAFILLHVVFDIQILFASASSSCKQFCKVPSAWIPQARNVCHGTTNTQYGAFKIKQDCMLVAIRLAHVSGYLTPYKEFPILKSRWGTGNPIKNVRLGTVILKDDNLWLPEKLNGDGYYALKGFDVNDDVLFFKKKANVTAGEDFKIGYGRGFMNRNPELSEGEHCVDVDVSCLE